MNFITAPLIGDLFLLAILAIGREEVKGGTWGSDNISPIDIMGFFITLAYIAISIDASGLIRWLAFKVLQKGGKVGHKLFFYLYAFFFTLGSFIGNDPIILSGTAFLAYMTRVSSNIVHPRAWIHTQFAVANIASAILVSSNPTNLVLAGAFGVKFIDYTANIIVPVLVTVIVLFPFLLYIVFADESLIPLSIKMHELSEEAKAKKPVNPNIPNARGSAQEEEEAGNEHGNLLSLEEIMNPFLDLKGAAFGGVIMTATLVTLLAINAASQKGDALPVAFVTVPAAFVMLCWDIGFGWYHRHETREIARQGREDVERARRARAERALIEEEEARQAVMTSAVDTPAARASESENEKADDTGLFTTDVRPASASGATTGVDSALEPSVSTLAPRDDHLQNNRSSASVLISPNEKQESTLTEKPRTAREGPDSPADNEMGERRRPRATLVSLVSDGYRWSQETFPTVTAVVAHLPFALVPFAFAMFVLVQALVTKGWVQVFAYGWDHWVDKTGTVGAIGGMAFLSVILCNVSPSPINHGVPERADLIPCSSQAPTSEPPSSSRVSSRPGCASTRPTVPLSPTEPSGPRSTQWLSESTMGRLARHSAPRWRDCSGAISSPGSISMCGGLSSPA
jgi:Na+/H+ antiporter NhaD/arsenite permease-like protein